MHAVAKKRSAIEEKEIEIGYEDHTVSTTLPGAIDARKGATYGSLKPFLSFASKPTQERTCTLRRTMGTSPGRGEKELPDLTMLTF